VILTTLLGGAVTDARAWGDTTYASDLPTALVDIVSHLDDYLQAYEVMPTLADPSRPGENFNHRWDQDQYANFRTQLHRYAGILSDAYASTDKNASLALWQTVFGDAFKKAPALMLEAGATERAARDREQDLESDLHITIRPRYKINLVGRVEKKHGFRNYSLPAHSNQVGKGRELVFTVNTSGVPGEFTIYWKVRNSGKEAADAYQLRGQIIQGGRSHRESTRYKGTHYVEVYIVQDRVCVALDRQRVVIV